MKVCCFYTELHPRCKDALPDDAELVYTGGGDDHYWRELARRWDGSDDLVVTHHRGL